MVGLDMSIFGRPNNVSQIAQGSRQSSASSVLATGHQAIPSPVPLYYSIVDQVPN